MSDRLTDRESFNRLITVELALVEMLTWVDSLHPTTSRVVRSQRCGAALQMLRTEINLARAKLCDCAQQLRRIIDGEEAAHLSTCPAWRVLSSTATTVRP